MIFGHASINTVILSHLFNGTECWDYSMLKRIYRLFGKSREHYLFVTEARNLFFTKMFHGYGVNNINALLRKKTRIQEPSQSRVYKEFHIAMNEDRRKSIHFRSLNTQDRCIIRYLSFYYGYLCLFDGKQIREGIGNAYSDIHESPIYKNQVITYKFMCEHKIHNLSYYDLIIDSPFPHQRAYRLKQDVSVKYVGKTCISHHLECIYLLG